VKRDEDLLRELLFRLEAQDDYLSHGYILTDGSSDQERREYGHLLLLDDAGYVKVSRHDYVRITNRGHDFIEAIRNDTTWNKSKEIAEKAGVKTVNILFEIAVSIGKQKLKEMTGWEF
jgi:hypothetical protein